MGCGTIAALGLGLAGAGANEYANTQVRGKMNSLAGQELGRQQGFQRQGSDVFNKSFAQSTPDAANKQIQQGQQQLAGLINQVQGVPLSASMPSFGATNDATNTARQSMSNQASANLGGYSNYGLQQRLKDLEAGSNLGLISNQAQQSAGVLPYELQQAQGSQQGLQALGQLLGTAGMLTGLGSMMSAPVSVPNAAQMGAFSGGFGPVSAQAAGQFAGQVSPAVQQQLLNQLLMQQTAPLYFSGGF